METSTTGPVSKGNMASLRNWEEARTREVSPGERQSLPGEKAEEAGWTQTAGCLLGWGAGGVGGGGRVFILSEKEEKPLLCFKPKHHVNRSVFSKLSLVTVWRADWNGARLASRDL